MNDPVVTWDDADASCLVTDAAGRLVMDLRVRVLVDGEWRPGEANDEPVGGVHLAVGPDDDRGYDWPDERGEMWALEARAGDAYHGWVWTSGSGAVLAFSPKEPVEWGLPVVGIRLVRGAADAPATPVFSPGRPASLFSDADDEDGAVRIRLGLTSGILGAAWRSFREVKLSDVSRWMPDWLPPAALQPDDDVMLALADAAVSPGPDLNARYVDDDEGGLGISLTFLGSAPGHRSARVDGREGSHRLLLSYGTPLRVAASEAAREVLDLEPRSLPSTAGLVVAELIDDDAIGWLEQEDWLERGDLEAVATAAILAAATGDRRLLDQAWAALALQPVGPGFGLATMRVWLAQLTACGDAPPRGLTLLGRPASDAFTQLELAMLGYRSADALARPLACLMESLGARLPGRPLSLTAVRAAQTVSLLRLCPESWPMATEASRVAGEAEWRLLADAASETIAGRRCDGVGWLLLGAAVAGRA